MPAPIGSLVASLSLESAAFIRDLGKSAAAVERNTRQMNSSLAGIKKSFDFAAGAAKGFLGGFLTVGAVSQIVRLTDSIINNAAAIHDQAAAVGVGAAELQAYRQAGEEAGVATEQLDRSMGIFVRTVGQAKAGTGPLTQGLKGTNAALLEQIKHAGSTSEAMEIMLAAIKEAPNDFERARLSQLAFGRGGLAMARLAVESSAEARKAFIDLGLVIRTDVVDKADELQDFMGRVRATFTAGITNSFFDQLNTSMLQTTDNLVKARDAGAIIGEQLGKAWNDVAIAVGKVSDFASSGKISDLAGDFFTMGNAQIREGSVLDWLRDRYQDTGFTDFLARMGASVNAMVAAPGAATGGLGAGKGTTVGADVLNFRTGTPAPQVFPKGDTSFPSPQGAQPFFPPDPKLVNESTDSIINQTKAIGDWDTKTTDALGRSLELEDMQKEGTSLFAELQTPMEKYASTIERISALQQAGAIDAETYSRAHVQATMQVLGTGLDVAGQLSGALAGLFKDNKAVAIANAVINTAESITKSLATYGFTPLGIAAAAAAAIAGAAQIATIVATQPGSGSKSPSLKGGKTQATKSTSKGSDKGSSSGPAQVVTIKIEGDVFGPEHFRKIVAGINGVQRDGTALLQVA